MVCFPPPRSPPSTLRLLVADGGNDRVVEVDVGVIPPVFIRDAVATPRPLGVAASDAYVAVTALGGHVRLFAEATGAQLWQVPQWEQTSTSSLMRLTFCMAEPVSPLAHVRA
jgi:hypothetical protein